MRLFLAISLPQKVKEQIDIRLKDIKLEYQDLKWVGSDNYHITVHFFGERASAEKIISKVEQSLFESYSFYMYSLENRLSIRKKVLAYLAFSRNKELEDIVGRVNDMFNTTTKLKFIPHVTLARYRIPSKQQYLLLKKKFSKLDIDVSFKVSKLTLFDCINYGVKPEYKIVKEFNLLER
ncbi:MAG: RNA 2',3'-cyclic phosphodiesterase [Patescibacteria group bacterium]